MMTDSIWAKWCWNTILGRSAIFSLLSFILFDCCCIILSWQECLTRSALSTHFSSTKKYFKRFLKISWNDITSCFLIVSFWRQYDCITQFAHSFKESHFICFYCFWIMITFLSNDNLHLDHIFLSNNHKVI